MNAIKDLAKKILNDNPGVSLSILDSEWFYENAEDFANYLNIQYSSIEDIAKSITPKQMEYILEIWLDNTIISNFSYDFGSSIDL